MTAVQPMSFLIVGDLLEDTITRTTGKSQSGGAADVELAWLRKRLDNERRDPRARGKLALETEIEGSGNQQQARSVARKVAEPADKENGAGAATAATLAGSRANKVSPTGMSVLQLRRFLRVIGQPTVGLKPVLTARLETAMSSGAVKTFVDKAGAQPRAAVECAGERRKTETMLAMAKSMLDLDGSPVATAASDTATAAKLPLRESLSSVNNERNSRSSAGSSTGKALLQQAPATPAASKLSGQEQDAVVAKIRSAAKRSASPEKKLPYQDDDTPNTKGARLKKEMEDRLARQKAAKKLQQQPAPAVPSAEAEELPTPVTPPSLRPPVPSSPAPMPPASPPRATHPPPPPTADAPQPAVSTTSSAPPAPEGSAPRAADLAKCMDTAAAAAPDEVEASVSTVVPASPTESAPVPTELTKKGVTGATIDAVADGVAALSVKGEGKGSSAAANASPEKQPTSPSKFGSPGRHRVPSTKTPTRKANPFAKDSISSPGPSGLKAAAHKAYNRVGVNPTSSPEVPSPTGSSTTQDAFAKFRAMDSNSKNSKKGGGSVQSFKARHSPSPKKQQPSAAGAPAGQMPPPQKLDFGGGGSKTPNNNKPTSSSKGAVNAGLSGFSATKAAAKAKSEAAAAAQVTSLAEQAAADEARRDAQAKAELKTREAALKAATEREEKIRREEERKKREAEKKRQAERRAAERLAERAAAAEALRKAEDKKRAEKRAALEKAAAAAARKEEEEKAAAAAEQKRATEAAAAAASAAAAAAAAAAAKPAKPPTPPRAVVKPPPTPPRPGHKGQAQAPPPPTPPRPAGAAAAAGAQVPSGTPPKPTAAEARQLALAKKKEEIAKRMEETRKNKATTPAPAAPAPVAKVPAAPKQAATPAPTPVKSTPVAETKEERESYDAYDVEPESGSESGDEEEEAAPEIQEPQEPADKSAIPDWARGKALAKILDKQYGGPNPLNPDKIFPEFFTCNLEHIFNTKKQKWDRSSSGNWHTDRLTIAEKLAYQRAMGFDK